MIWMLLTYSLLAFYWLEALQSPAVVLPPAMFVSLALAPSGLAFLYRKKFK